jgi:hypothetical protein
MKQLLLNNRLATFTLHLASFHDIELPESMILNALDTQ